MKSGALGSHSKRRILVSVVVFSWEHTALYLFDVRVDGLGYATFPGHTFLTILYRRRIDVPYRRRIPVSTDVGKTYLADDGNTANGSVRHASSRYRLVLIEQGPLSFHSTVQGSSDTYLHGGAVKGLQLAAGV